MAREVFAAGGPEGFLAARFFVELFAESRVEAAFERSGIKHLPRSVELEVRWRPSLAEERERAADDAQAERRQTDAPSAALPEAARVRPKASGLVARQPSSESPVQEDSFSRSSAFQFCSHTIRSFKPSRIMSLQLFRRDETIASTQTVCSSLLFEHVLHCRIDVVYLRPLVNVRHEQIVQVFLPRL